LPWNQWQLSRGMGGRLRLESVATLVWNTHTGFQGDIFGSERPSEAIKKTGAAP